MTPTVGAATLGGNRLLRRLMMVCPETGSPTDTGRELTAIPSPGRSHLLVDCLECGQDHLWRLEDAFAE